MRETQNAYKVLGVDISDYSAGEFFNKVEERLKTEDCDTPPTFVVTVNPEIVVESIVDSEFKQILQNSSINTADGVGISWAVKFLYNKEIERITGSDSVQKICAISAEHGQPVFLYGGMPNVVSRTAEILGERIENLDVAGYYSPDSPSIALEELPEATQRQLERAAVIFVALGAPAQEKWIHENLHKLPSAKLVIGIGGSFDFISGEVRRAPSWMCRAGMEWFYRLCVQPSRWRRMLKLPLFALNVMMLKMSNAQSSKQMQKVQEF